MAGISEELRLDIAGFLANLNTAMSQARASIASLNAASGGSGMFKGGPQAAKRLSAATAQATQSVRANTAAVNQNAAAATQAAAKSARFSTNLKRTGTATAVIGGVGLALLVLSKRFPIIGVQAAKMWKSIRAGSSSAVKGVKATTNAYITKTPAIARATLAVFSMVGAYRALRGAAGGAAKAAASVKPNKGGAGGISGGGGLGFMKGAGMVGVGSALGAGIIGGIKKAAGGIKAALTTPISAAADDEALKVRMDVLVGDPGKADAVIEDLKERAANTPLQFGDMANAAGKLLAFGESADRVGDVLGRVGDVSSGVGAPIGEIAEIYGKARVQGTLFAEDINQLTGRGIPVIQEFAKQMGVSEGEVKKLASQGKVTFPMLEKAFISLTGAGGRFEGMLAKQADTFTGKMSTLKDNITETWRVFGKPITSALKPLLDMGIEQVKKLKDSAAEIGQKVANGIRMIVAAIGVLASMDLGEFAQLLGDALKVGIVAAVNLLWRGAVAAVAAAGQLLQEYGKNLVLLFSMLSDGAFWKGMGDALLGVAQMFIAVILKGMANVIKGIKDATGKAGEKLFGDSDKTLNAKGDELMGKGRENAAGGAVALTPYLREIGERAKEALGNVGKAFKDTFDGTGDKLESPQDSLSRLSEFADKIKAAMDAAKQPVDAAGGGGAGEDGTAVAGAAKLPAVAGKLAGAMNTLTGKSAGTVLQEKGNALLKEIADNTSKGAKQTPAPRRSRAARAMGTFT